MTSKLEEAAQKVIDEAEDVEVIPDVTYIEPEHTAPYDHRGLSLVETDENPLALGAYAFGDYGDMLHFAREIAVQLSRIVREVGLEVYIGSSSKPYIVASGWSTMIAMLGVVPIEKWSSVEDGVYTSYVELRRVRDGALMGGASAECGNLDEVDKKGNPTWAERAAFARKSMSITRAMSKACRLSYAWVVELAGYQPRAAEEMAEFDPEDEQATHPVIRRQGQWEEPVITFLVSNSFVQGDTESKATSNARGILDHAPFGSVPFGELELLPALAWVFGWLEIAEKHPRMKAINRAKIVKGGWDEDETRAEWEDWALSQIPPEVPSD